MSDSNECNLFLASFIQFWAHLSQFRESFKKLKFYFLGCWCLPILVIISVEFCRWRGRLISLWRDEVATSLNYSYKIDFRIWCRPRCFLWKRIEEVRVTMNELNGAFSILNWNSDSHWFYPFYQTSIYHCLQLAPNTISISIFVSTKKITDLT